MKIMQAFQIALRQSFQKQEVIYQRSDFSNCFFLVQNSAGQGLQQQSNFHLMTALRVYEVASGVFAHIAVRIPDLHSSDSVNRLESRFQPKEVGASKAV